MISTFTGTKKPRKQRGLKRPRPIPRRPAGAMQARPVEHIDRFSAHTGVGLDVSKIISAYRLAEAGWPANQCDLFEDRHEVDAHMRSAYDGRVEAVARKEWVIQAGGPDQADIDAAEMLQDALIEVPNATETFEHQLRANWYGYNATEIDWRRIDGTAVPVWFENVIPQRIVFDDTDRPRLVTQLGDTEGTALAPGKWWYSCRTGRLAATSGLMRTSTWWSHFKTLSVRDWLQFADRFGVPYVTGAYDDEMEPEERSKLEDAVRYIGSDGYAIFNKAAEIIIHAVENGEHADQIMGGLIGLCDQQNSKLIQGATLVNETGGPGSFALGRVHQGQYHDLVKADAMRLAQSFSTQIGIPFLRFNGITARPPKLKMYLTLDISLKEQIDIASTCANELGMEIDENQIRQMTLLRPPSGTPLLGTKGTVVPLGGSSGGEGVEGGTDDG